MLLSDQAKRGEERATYARRTYCCHPELEKADQANIERLFAKVPIPGVPLFIELPLDESFLPHL